MNCPATTIENKELGITYVYKSTTTQKEMDTQRKQTFQNLLKWYEDNKEKLLPRIHKRNVEWCREEIDLLTKD